LPIEIIADCQLPIARLKNSNLGSARNGKSAIGNQQYPHVVYRNTIWYESMH